MPKPGVESPAARHRRSCETGGPAICPAGPAARSASPLPMTCSPSLQTDTAALRTAKQLRRRAPPRLALRAECERIIPQFGQKSQRSALCSTASPVTGSFGPTVWLRRLQYLVPCRSSRQTSACLILRQAPRYVAVVESARAARRPAPRPHRPRRERRRRHGAKSFNHRPCRRIGLRAHPARRRQASSPKCRRHTRCMRGIILPATSAISIIPSGHCQRRSFSPPFDLRRNADKTEGGSLFQLCERIACELKSISKPVTANRVCPRVRLRQIFKHADSSKE